MYESGIPSSGKIRLEECPTCGRKFNENAFEKHVKICEEVFVKKRKAFNSKAHRIIDQE
jgi:hypothetical protein